MSQPEPASGASGLGDVIRYAPTDGLTYNPNSPKYWDEAALQKELDRAFDLCNGCRMCFKYCPSFPTLFDACDEHGDVRKLPQATRDRVIDECFQCKLCYTACPYTDAEGHEFRLDFPRLLMRANAVRRRKSGVPLREKVLSNPDRLGKMATLTPGLANFANEFRPHRALMRTVLGIHPDKKLPRFATRTFSEWFAEHAGGRDEIAGGTHRVVLFSTCFVQWNEPEIGQAAVEVLEHNDCKVACPKTNCCGMPALDGGDIAFAREQAERNVRALLPWVEKGYQVAAVNPTCSLMMREEYPELLDDPARPELAEAAKKVAAATRDVCEYAYGLRAEGNFREDFKSTPGGPVAYHAPCHLRKQQVGFRGRDLIRRIPGAQPRLVQECCGHDGTWAMKEEYFELSLKVGQRAFDEMKSHDAAVWSTDCPLAALQFEQACGVKPLHPMQVLARAYREDGFPERVPAKE